MRKLYALLILIVVFFPLAFSAMILTSIRPWILDRGFYERLVNDERLYEALLTDDLPNRINREDFVAVEQLPVDALSIALRGFVTPEYVQAQSLNVIHDVFNYLEGRDRNFELSLDITPIKASLAGEGTMRFAAALAAALQDCADDQQPIAPGGSLTRCIAADGSVEAAAEQIADALPAVIEIMPDRIVINDGINLRMNWYDWLPSSSVQSALDLAIISMIWVAVAVGLVGAYLGMESSRGRLKWLSTALFAPSALVLLIGLTLTLPAVVGAIGDRASAVRYSEAYRQAVAGVIVQVVQEIGSGFLVTGVVACLIALGLWVWSWAAPAAGKRKSKIVQVPIRNMND